MSTSRTSTQPVAGVLNSRTHENQSQNTASALSPRVLSGRIRRTVLEQSKRAGVGHIGSSLSIAELLAALFGGTLRVSAPEDPERERFVLSKGHAALALYAALHAVECLDDETLASFNGEGSAIATHPEHVVRGVDFSTGSLGQGLSYAVGAALAARIQTSSRRTFALLSDAECNEGSTWEAVMFAGHHRLGNLIVLVDVNGQQALGYTREVIDLSPMSVRWHAFGWDVHEVDGHDVDAISETIENLDATAGPHVLLARTTFGKGVSYMERSIAWHYLPMSDEQYEQAMFEHEQSFPDLAYQS